MKWQKTDSSIVMETPAKLNLFLEVTGKRTDGFHELETVITAIDRVDKLSIELNDLGTVNVDCQWNAELEQGEAIGSTFGALPQGHHNLVHRAAELILNRCGLQKGLEIRLVKSIPLQAGLGGASGNAAGTLLALNELFQADLSIQTLVAWAAELGSDVPFFIHGGYAVCKGRGELVTPLAIDLDLHFVVFKPGFGLSTPRVFAELKLPESSIPFKFPDLSRPDWNWSEHLFNRLQQPAEACQPEIGLICNQLRELGCSASMMTGSGSCCFGICETGDQARQIASEIMRIHSGFAFTCRNLKDFSVRE